MSAAVIGSPGGGELPPATRLATIDELTWFIGSARAPAVRTIRQFAADEIVIPEGQFAGRKWRPHRQPYGAAIFDLMASGPWRRRAFLGPVQSGKTFHCFGVPICHALFEVREQTVICGVPTMDVARKKWRKEILPLIQRSRYANLLPTSGAGSRGGANLEEVQFRNGTELIFLSGGGGDETRSGLTSRVIKATEVDKFDVAGPASREADPVSQIVARADSYDGTEEIDLECTVSVREGRIWQERMGGTQSIFIHPCPHCGKAVSPEREHLQGWQEAATKIQARRLGYFVCPECGERLSDAERYEMNQRLGVLHLGQEVTPGGEIVGEPIETDTLAVRWSAFQNLFWSTGKIAAKEWSAAHAEDEENAKKEILQFWWAVPYEPPLWDATPLVAAQVKKRFGRETKGLVPEDAKFLTVGVDMHKRFGVWIAIAWREDGSGHVVDYGTFEVFSDDLGVERAIIMALEDFKEGIVMAGWQTRAGEPRIPDQVWLDAGYQGDAEMTPIYDWIRQQGTDRRFRPCLGRGVGQQYKKSYSEPKKTGAEVVHIGNGYHVSKLRKHRVFVVEVNADAWKSGLHERLATPEGQPGALVFFHSTNPNEHTSITKQICEAEKVQEEFIPGKGLVRRWFTKSRNNHGFDAAYLAAAAGHLLGVRIVGSAEGPPAASAAGSRPTPVRTPDGRAFLVTER